MRISFPSTRAAKLDAGLDYILMPLSVFRRTCASLPELSGAAIKLHTEDDKKRAAARD